MTAKFDTAEYVRSHGRAPRGTGTWAFRPAGATEWTFTPCMSYTDAKRWFAAQNPSCVYVVVGA